MRLSSNTLFAYHITCSVLGGQQDEAVYVGINTKERKIDSNDQSFRNEFARFHSTESR